MTNAVILATACAPNPARLSQSAPQNPRVQPLYKREILRIDLGLQPSVAEPFEAL
jgi:hypothetical protein